MPKNLGLYNDDLSTPRKQDVDACYGPNNAPPYPVTSVDGKKGDVVLNATNIPFIVGTQKEATGRWTGVTTEIDTLEDGQTIRYWLPYNGSGNATLNLTLSDGSTTGAINCYKTGTTRLTTQYYAGSVIILTYRKNVTISSSTTKYTGWWADADYSTSNATAIVYSGSIKCGTTAIVKGNIIVGKDGVYNQLNSGQSFDISYPILYASGAISASAITSSAYEEINLTIATTQAIALTAYKPVFIQGTLYGNIFTPINTTPLTQTLPTSEDGYVYILLGVAYSTTNIRLLSRHPIFAYKGGVFGLIYSVVLNKGDVGLNNVDNVKQYSANNPPPYPVTSVNSKSGAVTLSKGDVGLGNVDNVKQYSKSNPPPYPVTSVNKKTGAVVLDASDVNAVAKTGDSMTGTLTVGSASLETNGYVTGTWFKTTANTALSTKPSKIAVIDNGWIYSRTPAQIKNDIGLNNVDNIKQYSASNPPPYPVTSVNGQTGDVTVSADTGIDIVVQSAQPSGQNVGDFWYQVT